MRTTLTLDADVAAVLRRIRNTHGGSFKAAVNNALRLGLRQMATPAAPPAHYRTPIVNLGRCLVGNLDDVAEAHAAAEEEEPAPA